MSHEDFCLRSSEQHVVTQAVQPSVVTKMLEECGGEYRYVHGEETARMITHYKRSAQWDSLEPVNFGAEPVLGKRANQCDETLHERGIPVAGEVAGRVGQTRPLVCSNYRPPIVSPWCAPYKAPLACANAALTTAEHQKNRQRDGSQRTRAIARRVDSWASSSVRWSVRTDTLS